MIHIININKVKMKTSKILIGAMAVMSLAACQNDELVSVKEQASLPMGREQIDVKIVPAQELGSRMTNTNGVFGFEDTDSLGAALVDPSAIGTVANGTHYGNALFTYNETTGEFTTASTLSVGAYAFYYPYNKANTTTRGGVIVKTLGAQKYDPTGDEMMKNNFMVAPIAQLGGSEAGELVLPMTFRSIYGYGKLTLVNSLDEELEILKMVIENGEEQFVIGGTLAPATIKEDEATADLYVNLTVEDADAKALFTKADSVYMPKTEDDTTTPPAPVQWINTENAVKGNVTMDFMTGANGVKIAAGDSVSTRILIPSGSYTPGAEGFKVVVYTTAGKTAVYENLAKVEDGKIVVRNSSLKSVRVEIEDEPEAIGADEIISIISKEDFVATMKQYKDIEEAQQVKVNIAAGLAFDADMIAAIPAKVNDLIITNDVTFQGTMTLKNITLQGNATLKGDVKLGAEVKFTANKKLDVASGAVAVDKSLVGVAEHNINVAKGASLTLPNKFEGSFSSTINVAGGTLNLGTAPAADEDGLAIGLGTVTSGIVNVNVPLSGTGNVNLGDDEKDAAALTFNNNSKVTTLTFAAQKNVTVNNAGEMTMTTNAGVINNSKKITLTTNTGKIVNAATATVCTVTNNHGTIENSGVADVTANGNGNNGDEDKIKGVIKQMAETAVLTVGTNNVDGTIETISGSMTQVNTAQSGDVVWVAGALFANNAETSDGNVAYKVDSLTADGWKALDNMITKVIFNAGYESDKDVVVPGNVKVIEFNGDVKLAKTLKATSALEMIFNSVSKLEGQGITVGASNASADLTWKINNGQMVNWCPVTVYGRISCTFGGADPDEGILAGSIWNQAIVKATEESKISGWAGKKVETFTAAE